MKDLKDKLEGAKDKLEGEVNETAGKITGNEQLELKGKLQNIKADLKNRIDPKQAANKVKEEIAGKINDMLDKKK